MRLAPGRWGTRWRFYRGALERDTKYDILHIMDDITPASLVRQIRQRSELTQVDLARRSGTSQPVIARLEAGRGNPTMATLQRLAEAAGFTLSFSLVPRTTGDGLIEAYRRDIDRTLLRRNLKLTVDQRIRELARLQAFDAEVRRAGQEARRSRGPAR